jgi:hypothetical protein
LMVLPIMALFLNGSQVLQQKTEPSPMGRQGSGSLLRQYIQPKDEC